MLKRIIIGPGYPLRGGISESNQALNNVFNKNGYGSSKIISYSLQYPNSLFPGKTQKVDTIDHKVAPALSLINTLNPLSWYNTARWIIAYQPDYVIVRYWHPYFAFCLSFIASLLRKHSIPVIAWVDNIYPHDSIIFQKILSSFFVRSFDRFLVMSNSVRDILIEDFNISKCQIVNSPHPIYNVFGKKIDKKTARNKIGIKQIDKKMPLNKNRYILFFGLVRKYKGLDLLLDVMALDIIQSLNIKLIIAGEFYHSKGPYLKKINLLGIKDRVIIHDFYIHNDDVSHYFSASDLIVQPYLSATQSGVSMIAYNFDKPMLLTNVGGLSDYVNHGVDGYIVEPNVQSIALALKDFYMNDREEGFSNMVKSKKSLYDWKNMANQFDILSKKNHNNV